MNDFISKALELMRQDGLVADNLIGDGQWHRCSVTNKNRRNLDGSYKYFSDKKIFPPTVIWNNFFAGINGKHSAKTEKAMTAKERRAYQECIKAAQKEREKEQSKKWADAAKKAQTDWGNAKEAGADHFYLRMKRVKPYGIRVNDAGELLIPVFGENGQLQSYERILPREKDNKRYFPGGKIQDGYFPIRASDRSGNGPLVICEGYATGASIYDATGFTVLIAFNAGNLLAVAKLARRKYKKRPICIAADFDVPANEKARQDYPEPGGIGVYKAREAAKSINGYLAICPSKNGGKMDFNDLANAYSLERVRQEIEKAIQGEALKNPKGEKKSDIDQQYTEDDLARIFEDKYKDTLRYDHERGKWYGWNGKYWVIDKVKRSLYLAREICREAAKNTTQKQVFYLKKASTIKAVESLAQSETKLGVTHEIWDADDFLLGTPNGVVDLKTGKLMAAQKNHYITKITSIAPSDNANAPLWLKFLDEATNEDVELQRFLRQMAGICLTGSTKEQAMFFVYGDGGNGKSVFLTVLNEILNDYAKVTAIETFTASKIDRHPTEMAALHGARLVSANETEEGRAWAESRLKQFTGGDMVSARFMRQDPFEFKPKAKLIIIGNHKPTLHNVDDAMRRRINIIPFTNKPKEMDRELGEKLRAEYPAILRWMIDGCLDWLRNGLVRPECVTEATQEYFENQDTFGQWLEECCNIYSTFYCQTSKLFDSWKQFAESRSIFVGNSVSFAGQMQKRGFTGKKYQGKRCYFGLTLKPEENQSYERGCSID